MVTLSVKDIGPIRQAKLDIKEHTVLIGPQGSGKSTLAKLIAIAAGRGIWSGPGASWNSYNNQNAFDFFGLRTFLSEKSSFLFSTQNYDVEYSYDTKYHDNQRIDIFYNRNLSHGSKNADTHNPEHERLRANSYNWRKEIDEYMYRVPSLVTHDTLYVSAERTLISILSSSIWSLLNSNTNLPKSVIDTGSLMETAINEASTLEIPYLSLNVLKEEGKYIIKQGDSITELDKSASGYQAIIPLQLIAEYQRKKEYWMQKNKYFIIEEPELNLYPQTQKDLIYNLISGIEVDFNYADAKWLFTTHSPYILSSLNTLLLAHKVAHQDEETRVKVEDIIPVKSWIDPDKFSAYYVANGTAFSIIDPETGLINDNKLDEASDFLADELNTLFSLYRPVSHA